MFNVGPTELLVILVLALMVFGPKRLPEMSRQIGRGLREFRRATQDVQGELRGVLSFDDDDDADDDDGSAPLDSSGLAPGATETQTAPSRAPGAGRPASNGSGAGKGHTVIDPNGD